MGLKKKFTFSEKDIWIFTFSTKKDILELNALINSFKVKTNFLFCLSLCTKKNLSNLASTDTFKGQNTQFYYFHSISFHKILIALDIFLDKWTFIVDIDNNK